MDPDYISELLSRLGDGFLLTLRIFGWSLLFATLLGTVLGSMRVSPIAPLRAVGTSYVNIFRNTPLVVVFIFVAFGLPELGGNLNQVSFFWRAVIALSTYTAAFVCEVVRSGINTVDAGQAEAARSIGMGFSKALRQVILPQAFRNVIPPLASVYIAMVKNTSVASAFGVTEATGQLSLLQEDFPQYLTFNFLGIAAGYIVIVAGISTVANLFERKVAVSR